MTTALRICDQPRTCSCNTRFTMRDYPQGYFERPQDLQPGSGVNVCPRCEANILRRANQMMMRQAPMLPEDLMDGVNEILTGNQMNIHLLLTGHCANDEQRKLATEVYRHFSG